jgi:RNA polymerase sigma-70 factor (ECF subfamily)
MPWLSFGLFLILESEILEIVKRVTRGDTEAFGDLVGEYESFVYNTICQTIGNKNEAYDVSQEVFIKAFKAIKQFKGESKFSTWLYRITLNAAKDYLRFNKKTRNNVSLTDYTEDDENSGDLNTSKPPEPIEESDSSRPEEAFERKEKQRVIREAIQNLTEDHRNVVVLRDMEGYSYEDIAQMLDIEVGTVKSRLNRARNSIKEYLLSRNLI